MEGFSSSENLDDGELWLPSDIFPVEEPVPSNNKLKNNNTSSFCCCYSCLHHHHHHHCCDAAATAESVIQRFAAISLVPNPFPITERFKPAERCCSCTDCSLSEYFERNRELLRTGPLPVYPPVQHQVENLMEARARVLQMQEQNRFIRMQRRNLGLDRFTGNRFLPFVGGGGGGGGGFNGESSSMRDYGGTGVFLPRTPADIENNGRKGQGGRIRQDVQQNGQRYPCI